VKNLQLSLGLSVEVAGSNTSSPSKPDGEPNLSMFSGSAKVVYNAREIANKSHLLILNDLEYDLYQILLGPNVALRQKVVDAVNKAKIDVITGANKDSPYQPYMDFLQQFGTHIIDSVTVGGKLEMTNLVDKDFKNDTTTVSVAANLSFKKMFGLESATADLDLNIRTEMVSLEQNSKITLKAFGGDPNIGNFFSGNANTAKIFSEWQATLITNPTVIRYRVKEISWLFGSQRADMHRVVTAYLQQGPEVITKILIE